MDGMHGMELCMEWNGGLDYAMVHRMVHAWSMQCTCMATDGCPQGVADIGGVGYYGEGVHGIGLLKCDGCYIWCMCAIHKRLCLKQ